MKVQLETIENMVQHLCIAGGFSVREAARTLGLRNAKVAQVLLDAANKRQPKLCASSCLPRLSQVSSPPGPMCPYCVHAYGLLLRQLESARSNPSTDAV